MLMEDLWNVSDPAKSNFLEKTLSQFLFFFFTTNLPRTGPVLNPIFSGKMPAINNPGNRAVLSLNLI